MTMNGRTRRLRRALRRHGQQLRQRAAPIADPYSYVARSYQSALVRMFDQLIVPPMLETALLRVDDRLAKTHLDLIPRGARV